MVIKGRVKSKSVQACRYDGNNLDEVRTFCQLRYFYIGPKNQVEVYVNKERWWPLDIGCYVVKEDDDTLSVMSAVQFLGLYEVIE